MHIMILNKITLHRIILGFLLFAVLFLGAIKIGPISIRNICIILLSLYAAINFSKIKLDRNSKIYILYLIVLCFSNIMSGQFTDFDFIQNLISYHCVSLLLIIALPIIIKDNHNLHFITKFFIVIYLINAIVSILQYYNNSLGWNIALLINPSLTTRLEGTEYIEGAENFLSKSIVSGITGFVVANGYFSTIFLPVITNKLLQEQSTNKEKIISLLFLMIGCVTIFMIQQRMAFALLIMYVLFVFVAKTKARHKILLLLLSLLIIPSINFKDIDMGRLTTDEISSDSRMNQGQNFIKFFNTKDSLWGADLNDAKWGDSMGHNTIMDAMRRGGIFTFVVYLILFASVTLTCFKLVLKSLRYKLNYTLCYSLSCVLFLAYSMTHSTGIQSGSIYFWVLYVAMSVSYKMEYRNMQKINN